MRWHNIGASAGIIFALYIFCHEINEVFANSVNDL